MSNHVVSIRINAKGYEDFLDSRFRYANRLYNKMTSPETYFENRKDLTWD